MVKRDIDEIISDLKDKYPENKAGAQTCQSILQLLYAKTWTDSDKESIAQLARKVDVTRTLESHYDVKWNKVSDSSPLSDPWFSLFSTVLVKCFKNELGKGVSYGLLLKRINTIFKALDLSDESWVASELKPIVEEDFKNLLARSASEKTPKPTYKVATENSSIPLKTIPLTVLFSEGPIARAYLETIRSMGFKPQKIIQMVASHDLVTKKKVGRFLPAGIRARYASNIQFSRMNFWPGKIAKDLPALRQSIFAQVKDMLNFSESSLTASYELRAMSEYSDDVEQILVKNLRDPVLLTRFKRLPQTTLLFTGGGIVPQSLLEIPGVRLLHIHPGFLPDIRGGDCALWSTLLTGRTSATCFYMAPGIDTGDIILPSWLPPIQFQFDQNTCDLKTLYRAVYSFFDPWVRSFVLRQVLEKFEGFDDLSSTFQKEEDGITYHFMHPRLQLAAIRHLFAEPSSQKKAA